MKYDFSNTNWDNIKDEAEKKGGDFKDDTFWNPDKTKPATYVFRFLPFFDENGNPSGWVEKKTHRIVHYPESGQHTLVYGTCPKTKDKTADCPICDHGWELYNTKIGANQTEARSGWIPKNNWISNIYMINDPINPDNNGKIFKYEYGISIFKLIKERLSPSEESLTDGDFVPFNPFIPTKAGNFKLKVLVTETNIGGKKIMMPNYNQSTFYNEVKPVATDEDELKAIMGKVYDLKAYIAGIPVISKEKMATLKYLTGQTVSTEAEDDTPEIDEVKEEPKKGKGKAKAKVDEDIDKDDVTEEERNFFANELDS